MAMHKDLYPRNDLDQFLGTRKDRGRKFDKHWVFHRGNNSWFYRICYKSKKRMIAEVNNKYMNRINYTIIVSYLNEF